MTYQSKEENPMTPDEALLLVCRNYLLEAFNGEADRRSEHPDDWVARERNALAVAANAWAEARGIAARVTVDDVEKLEGRAVGHVDYATKLALYVAESIVFSGVSEGKHR